jgi:ABC-type Zn uptake system ZnuABC Zn-binding protein ZnuA
VIERMALAIALLVLLVALPMAAGTVRVVSTTTIVGDVVARIGGEQIDQTVLLAVNADPHVFEPTPQDLVAVAGADIVFINGVGLEADLVPLLENAAGPVISLSERIAVRTLEPRAGEGAAQGCLERGDPHVWFDPTNVMIWADVVAEALAAVDPDHASHFRARAQTYRTDLANLDLWIWQQVERIPHDRRTLVADHAALGYFATRYGFKQIGAIVPGFSTLAEPLPRELAELEKSIGEFDVPAIFVGTTVNPSLARQVAVDTDTRLVPLYVGSLSAPGGPANSYINLMRYDVTAIVEGLATED